MHGVWSAVSVAGSYLGRLERLPHWVRWLLVLPCAALAGLCVLMLANIVYLLFTHGSPELEYFRYVVLYFVFPYVFVRAGAMVAPYRRFLTASLLAIVPIAYGIGPFWMFAEYVREGRADLGLTIVERAALIAGLAAAVIWASRFRSAEKA